ncbi:IS30 family transposase [uncultured Roseobacter sp.]|uniref:IS30 family transposase n=1 Tax=uncultured Roseobacter sp. TaxID=114847 RepID=UPI002628B3F4|nr:IS30 family transposase [uncultured Roseobacter sp.]
MKRKTRYAVLFRNNDRNSTHFMNKLMDVMEPLPRPARKLITFGLGFEFRAWRKLKSGIGTDSWFCDPQAPWQKRPVESLNKRARRYLPSDTQLVALSNRNTKAICGRLDAPAQKVPGIADDHRGIQRRDDETEIAQTVATILEPSTSEAYQWHRLTSPDSRFRTIGDACCADREQIPQQTSNNMRRQQDPS